MKHLLLALLFLTGCATPHRSSDPAHRLADLIVERLSWMDDVALYKQARGLPIEDPKREAELLAAMEAKGSAAGLPAKAVRGFFIGQMEAAKDCQRSALLRMSRPKHVPDLATEVRPALDRIGEEMIKALVQTRAQQMDVEMVQSIARSQLEQRHFSETIIRPALRGLKAGLIK